MMAAIGGKSFESYDEGVKFIEQYAQEGFHPLKHCSRSTVAQYNHKILGRREEDFWPTRHSVFSVMDLQAFRNFQIKSRRLSGSRG